MTAKEIRAGAGDNHPHDVIVEWVVRPICVVVGEKPTKQARKHHQLVRIVPAFVSIEHHLHLFRAHPVRGLSTLRAFFKPGAAILLLIKCRDVCLEERVGISCREGPGGQCSATYYEAKQDRTKRPGCSKCTRVS